MGIDWGGVAATLLTAAIIGAFTWLLNSLRSLRREIAKQAAETDRRLDSAEGRLGEAEEIKRHNVVNRLSAVERSLAAVASADQMRRLHKRIDESKGDYMEMNSQIGEVRGELKAIHGAVSMIQSHLIGKGDR